MGLMVLGMVGVNQNISMGKKRVSSSFELISMINDMRKIFEVDASCKLNIAKNNIELQFPIDTPDPLNSLVDINSKVIYEIGKSYNGLRIVSMKVENCSSANNCSATKVPSSGGSGQVKFKLEVKRSINDQKVLRKEFFVAVESNSSNFIDNCFGIDSSELSASDACAQLGGSYVDPNCNLGGGGSATQGDGENTLAETCSVLGGEVNSSDKCVNMDITAGTFKTNSGEVSLLNSAIFATATFNGSASLPADNSTIHLKWSGAKATLQLSSTWAGSDIGNYVTNFGGMRATLGDKSVLFGNCRFCTLGENSVVLSGEGGESSAAGIGAIALGSGSYASGDRSSALTLNAIASGVESSSLGGTASGSSSFVLSSRGTADGTDSNSYSSGYAIKDYSHDFGYHTTTRGAYSLTFGAGNDDDFSTLEAPVNNNNVNFVNNVDNSIMVGYRSDGVVGGSSLSEIGAVSTSAIQKGTIKVVGSIGYGASSTEFKTYNLSNPSVPVELGSLAIPNSRSRGRIQDLHIDGNYAFLVMISTSQWSQYYARQGSMRILTINISNPSSPILVAGDEDLVPPTGSRIFNLKVSQGRGAIDTAKKNIYFTAYTRHTSDVVRLFIYDYSDPLNIVIKNYFHYHSDFLTSHYAFNGDYLYALGQGTSQNIFTIIDTSALPVGDAVLKSKTENEFGTKNRGIEAYSNFLYISNTDNDTIKIYSLASPETPTLIRAVNVKFPGKMQRYADKLISYNRDGLSYFDLADPGNPSLLGNMDSTLHSYWIEKFGDNFYRANHRVSSSTVGQTHYLYTPAPAQLSPELFIINNFVGVKTSTDMSGSYRFYVEGIAGGSSSWSQSSDRRLKRDIKIITSPLKKLEKLREVSFRWKDVSLYGDKKEVGYIAQEVEQILPELVNRPKGRAKYSMKYSNIIPLLVESIKELKQEVRDRKKENNKLEEQLILLEKVVSEGERTYE